MFYVYTYNLDIYYLIYNIIYNIIFEFNKRRYICIIFLLECNSNFMQDLLC